MRTAYAIVGSYVFSFATSHENTNQRPLHNSHELISDKYLIIIEPITIKKGNKKTERLFKIIVPLQSLNTAFAARAYRITPIKVKFIVKKLPR